MIHLAAHHFVVGLGYPSDTTPPENTPDTPAPSQPTTAEDGTTTDKVVEDPGSDDEEGGDSVNEAETYVVIDESLEVEGADAQEIAEEFVAGDVIGKVIAMVHQIRASPQAREFLRKMLLEEGIKEAELLNWVRTRWASLYHCIVRVIDMRQVSMYSCYH